MAEHQTPGSPTFGRKISSPFWDDSKEIWDFIDELEFAPYYDSPTPYKVNAVITDYGYCTGGTFQEPAWGPGQASSDSDALWCDGGFCMVWPMEGFARTLQNIVSGAD